jgi:hypothetical protein
MVFECDDIRATHEALRERGVEFTQEPRSSRGDCGRSSRTLTETSSA